MAKVCSNCGAQIQDGVKFCGKCGAPQNTTTETTNDAAITLARFCSSCGEPIQDGVKFCNKCGAPQSGQQPAASPVPQTAPPPQQNYNAPPQQNYNAPPQYAPRPVNRKDKTTAGILGIVLGGIGAHKFYLGDTTKGVIYLLFFWTGIPCIIGLVEGIKYLTMSQEEFDAKYNNLY